LPNHFSKEKTAKKKARMKPPPFRAKGNGINAWNTTVE